MAGNGADRQRIDRRIAPDPFAAWVGRATAPARESRFDRTMPNPLVRLTPDAAGGAAGVAQYARTITAQASRAPALPVGCVLKSSDCA